MSSVARWIVGFIFLLSLSVWVYWNVRFGNIPEGLTDESPRVLRVEFLDVGFGDATWIRTPAGKNILIDAGPGPNGKLRDLGQTLYFSTDNVKFSLAEDLKAKGVTRVDAVVLSETRYDHWGGLESVLGAPGLFVLKVYESRVGVWDASYENLRKKLKDASIPIESLGLGDEVETGDPAVRLVVLGPVIRRPPTDSEPVRASLVLRLMYDDFSVLLTGDVAKEAEYDLLEHGEYVRSTVLKVSSHGHEDATSPPLLDRIRPEAAVISVGTPNPFGVPDDDLIQRFIDRDISFFRTDLDGRISFVSNGKSWTVRTGR